MSDDNNSVHDAWPKSNIDELEQLAQELTYPPMLPTPRNYRRYKMTKGACESWNPEPHDLATCDQFRHAADTVFPIHPHDEREWLIVYKGCLFVTVEDQPEQAIKVGESIIIEPRQLHSARTEEETEYYAITVPKTRDWG